jgi:hypothetical protein
MTCRKRIEDSQKKSLKFGARSRSYWVNAGWAGVTGKMGR